MKFEPLKYIYQPSETENAYTLLLLHGTGGDESDLVPVARYFGDKLNVLSVRGNVSENGMPRFFRRLGFGIFDEADLAFRTDELVDFVQKISVTEKFDAGKVIALGYSNGANIAGAALAMHPEFLAGAILFRPMQPFKQMKTVKTENEIPVFMSNGAADGTIDASDKQGYLQWLNAAGFKVSHHSLDAGHQLTQKDVLLAVDWYSNHFVHTKNRV